MAGNTHGLDAIDDPNEYNQRRRIRAIHDARERVLLQRRHGKDLKAIGTITQQQYQSLLREAVESFVIEIEQLLRRYQADAEPNLDDEDDTTKPPSWYLTEAPLGSVALPPDGDVIEFTGLVSILKFPDPHVVTWETSQEPPAGFSTHPHGLTSQERREIQIPEDVLMRAVRVGMQFLNSVGLDADVEDSLPTVGFREVQDEDLDELDFEEVPIDDRA